MGQLKQSLPKQRLLHQKSTALQKRIGEFVYILWHNVTFMSPGDISHTVVVARKLMMSVKPPPMMGPMNCLIIIQKVCQLLTVHGQINITY